MDLQLEGKRALVTGSTGGIGYAIAETLIKEGAVAVINGRTSSRVDAAVNKLNRNGYVGHAEGLAADVGTERGAIDITKAHPDLEILVNNAAIFDPKPFEQIEDEEWRRFFEVNVMSGVRLSRYYLPRMKAKNWGRIVFISSESAIQIPSEMIHYGMTKTAQLAIARGLAETTAGTGVTVNSVLPGPTASEGAKGFLESLAQKSGMDPASAEREFFRTGRPTSLLRRLARPDEVASLVAYVCSPLSSASNGAALRVDGGVIRAIA